MLNLTAQITLFSFRPPDHCMLIDLGRAWIRFQWHPSLNVQLYITTRTCVIRTIPPNHFNVWQEYEFSRSSCLSGYRYGCCHGNRCDDSGTIPVHLDAASGSHWIYSGSSLCSAERKHGRRATTASSRNCFAWNLDAWTYHIASTAYRWWTYDGKEYTTRPRLVTLLCVRPTIPNTAQALSSHH